MQTGALILAIRAGPKIGQRLQSQVLGFLCGGVLFWALSVVLVWLGLLQP